MFGLDDWIAGLSDGGSIAVVVARRGAARTPPRDRSRSHRRRHDPRGVGPGARDGVPPRAWARGGAPVTR